MMIRLDPAFLFLRRWSIRGGMVITEKELEDA
jgi:hypothetical protein